MRIVKPSFEIEAGLDPGVLERLEKIGRVCYKSECRIDEGTAKIFVKSLLDRQPPVMEGQCWWLRPEPTCTFLMEK